MIGITVVAAVVFVIIVTVACFIFILQRRRRKAGSPDCIRMDFLSQHSHETQQLEGNNTSGEVASSAQETGTNNAQYQNLTADGKPVPIFTRGVVPYQRDYMNKRPMRILSYDRVQLIRPLAIDWLRNAWGNVDEFGQHVYDVMQRVRHVFVPYDKCLLSQRDLAGNKVETSNKTYGTMERPPAVILPTGSENASTSENFKNYNSHQFKEELSYYTNLDPTSNDPNVLWNEFKNNFLTIAEKHAPVRQRRVKSEHKPWLTKEIKRLMHHRDYLKRQSVRLTSSNYNEAYKRCKNKLNKLIKKTKEEYFKTKLFNANNSKESWQAINELLNKKPKTTHVTQLNVDDQVITGDTNIADCFNRYFSSIGCKLSKNVQNINVDPMTFVTPTESSFHFSCISVQETFDALNQLNSRKSPGLDGISVKLLKDTSDVIAQPLANIFNLSLQTAIFPDEWKIAKVSPVFKEGNKTDCGNYRPISVISVVAKLFEGLVYNQLRTFIADNSILVEQQSGFRSQHSTETALLGSTNEWLYNMDSGLINGVLFLDLKKAFDTVDHEILLKKLHLYGIKGTTYAWFESYIQNRKSICLMNGKKSHAREIRCGVPQGSNLGPILFLLYINDLPKCLETTKANLFADDTNLSCAGLDANEIETKLKRDLENVHSWLRCNKLTLNDSKTEFMIIGSRHHLTKFEDNPEISLAIRDNNIKRVTNKKSLGFIIDDQL
ncbi:Hypothetical predicted protein, partial [Paramuricea clavata]